MMKKTEPLRKYCEEMLASSRAQKQFAIAADGVQFMCLAPNYELVVQITDYQLGTPEQAFEDRADVVGEMMSFIRKYKPE